MLPLLLVLLMVLLMLLLIRWLDALIDPNYVKLISMSQIIMLQLASGFVNRDSNGLHLLSQLVPGMLVMPLFLWLREELALRYGLINLRFGEDFFFSLKSKTNATQKSKRFIHYINQKCATHWHLRTIINNIKDVSFNLKTFSFTTSTEKQILLLMRSLPLDHRNLFAQRFTCVQS